MRISDWSSDVCSSDLVEQHDRRPLAFQHVDRRGPVPRAEYLEIVEGPGELALQAEVVFDEQEFWGLALSHAIQSAQFQRSEEHTSELQSLMRISYAVFCLKKKNNY